MKNPQKQDRKSGKVHIGLLVAVALAAGGMGVWSELRAAGATVSNGGGKSVEAESADFSAYSFISENGDGTAFVYAVAGLDDGTVLSAFVFDNADFSISARVKPGQSGNGTGSGTGRFTAEGVIYDSTDFSIISPALVSVDIAVTDAGNVGAYLSHGVNTQTNPLTGERIVVRQHSVGNQAYGFTAGSLSVSADDVVVKESTGGYGAVSVYSSRSIERIK